MPNDSTPTALTADNRVARLVRSRLVQLHADAAARLEGAGTHPEVISRLTAHLEAIAAASQVVERHADRLTPEQLAGWRRGNDLQLVADLGACALAAGDDALAFQILRGVGLLGGGEAGAALDVGMALVLAGRCDEAIPHLWVHEENARETDGTASAVLAKLLHDRGDRRWAALAQRVLATGTNLEARCTCAALLGTETATKELT